MCGHWKRKSKQSCDSRLDVYIYIYYDDDEMVSDSKTKHKVCVKFILHVSLVLLQDKPFVLLGCPVEMCRLGNIHPYNRVFLIVK